MRRIFLAALLVIASALVPPSAQASPRPHCEVHDVPVRIADPGTTTYRLRGELCYRGPRPPKTVQVLQPGGTYNRSYWDFPYGGGVFSYVRAATAAGYATFSFDRIGTGDSEHPPFDVLHLDGEATALHDVVTALRSGALGGHAYRGVIAVGHSFSSAVTAVEVARYGDVDGFINTGLLHGITDAAAAALPAASHDSTLDPKFAGSGYTGYLTTVPGTRGRLYHDPRTSNAAIDALTERLKDVHTSTEGPEIFAYALAEPEDAVTRRITVPTLVILGGADFLMCGPGAADCSSPAGIRAFESGYWPSTGVTYDVVPRTGHSAQESATAPLMSAKMLAWSYSVARP